MCSLQYINRKCKAGSFLSGSENYLAQCKPFSGMDTSTFPLYYAQPQPSFSEVILWPNRCVTLYNDCRKVAANGSILCGSAVVCCATFVNSPLCVLLLIICSVQLEQTYEQSTLHFLKAGSEHPVVIKNNMLTLHTQHRFRNWAPLNRQFEIK